MVGGIVAVARTVDEGAKLLSGVAAAAGAGEAAASGSAVQPARRKSKYPPQKNILITVCIERILPPRNLREV
jgi:hypothetical protein